MNCKYCGKEFVPSPNLGKLGGGGPRKYCSPKCRKRAGAYNFYHTHQTKLILQQTSRQKIGNNSYRLHQNASQTVYQAVKKGKLIKPTACSECGDIPKRLEAHHYRGYDHPLEVVWLCTSCHQKIERGFMKLTAPLPGSI